LLDSQAILCNWNRMSRPLRIEYPDSWYHVKNRGRRGENVFADEKDYNEFLALLQETSKMFGPNNC
jgi:putative transposase